MKTRFNFRFTTTSKELEQELEELLLQHRIAVQDKQLIDLNYPTVYSVDIWLYSTGNTVALFKWRKSLTSDGVKDVAVGHGLFTIKPSEQWSAVGTFASNSHMSSLVEFIANAEEYPVNQLLNEVASQCEFDVNQSVVMTTVISADNHGIYSGFTQQLFSEATNDQ
jgi:hypothetical protein